MERSTAKGVGMAGWSVTYMGEGLRAIDGVGVFQRHTRATVDEAVAKSLQGDAAWQVTAPDEAPPPPAPVAAAPAPAAPKAEAPAPAAPEAEAPKADAKQDAPKADAKQDAPKADAKKDAPKADAKKADAKKGK